MTAVLSAVPRPARAEPPPSRQGFTKEIQLDRSVWAGYIKDYEGGTIMHVRRRSLSSVAARVSKLTCVCAFAVCDAPTDQVPRSVFNPGAAKRGKFRFRHQLCGLKSGQMTSCLCSQVILAKIRLLSQSHVVHPGLEFFADNPPGTKIDPADVPGLKESGWTPELDALCVLRLSRHFSSPDSECFDG